MADIKKLLESIDNMSKAAAKPVGPKFPGYWKGNELAIKSRSKMVGNESVIKDLDKTAKEKTFEWQIQEAYTQFKNDNPISDVYKPDPELKVYNTKDGGATFTQPGKNTSPTTVASTTTTPTDTSLKVYNPKDGGATFTEPNKPTTTPAPKPSTPAYTGIDPIVRQRMGMQPATQDEIRTYLDKNPPFIRSRDGSIVKSGTGAPVVSGGQTKVAKAADAVSPDRERAEALPKPQNIQTTPPVVQPLAPYPPNQDSQQITPRPPVILPNAPAQSNTVAVKPEPVAPAVQGRPSAPSIPTMPKNPAPGSWQDVWKNNPGLKNPNFIKIGQQIKLPDGTIAVVDKGDTLTSIAKRYRQGGYREGTPVNEADADYDFVDATKDVVSGEKLPSQAYGPLVYGKDYVEPAGGLDNPAGKLSAMKKSLATTKAGTGKLRDMVGQFKDLSSQGISKRDITDLDQKQAKIQKDITPHFTNKNTGEVAKTYGEYLRNYNSKSNLVNQKGAPVSQKVFDYWSNSQNKQTTKEAENKKIAGRYDQEDWDNMVLRLKKLAGAGPLKTVYDPEKRVYKNVPADLHDLKKKLTTLDKKDISEYANAQDPNAQTTSPSDPKPSTGSQEAQQQQDMKDQAVDMATAKSTTATLKNVLGPNFDPNAAATGITKANDGKPMSSKEQQAMGAITPLVMKAAETPSVKGQLVSALQNAGLAAKLGK